MKAVSMRQAWMSLVVLSLGFFLTLLDQSVVVIALPHIAADFGLSSASAVWVSTVYLLVIAGPLLVTGRLGDRYGYRLLFALGVGAFGLGAAVSAVAPVMGVLLVGRAIQGLGAAMLMPQCMAIINQIFPRHLRATALGLWGVVGSIAGLAGPVLGGGLISSFGWQAVFCLAIPVALVAVVASVLVLPRCETQATEIDVFSAALSILAVISLVAGIQMPSTLLVLSSALVVLVLVWRHKAKAQQLIPSALWAQKNFLPATLAVATMGAVAAGALIPVTMWLQEGLGLSAAEAGWVIAPMSIIALFLGPVCGVLADHMQPRLMHVVGMVFLALSFGLLWWAVDAAAGVVLVLIGVVILGLGQTIIWATNGATATRDVDPGLLGAASGVYNTARQVGSAVGVAAIGVMISSHSLSWAFLPLMLFVLLALVAVSFIRKVQLGKMGPDSAAA